MIVEDLAAKKLFNFITNEDPEGLRDHLKRHQEFLNVIDMHDALDFNLISYSAYRNESNCLKVILRYVQQHTLDRLKNDPIKHKIWSDKIKEWVD